MRDCLVALFDTNFDKKTCTFLMAFFPEIKKSHFCALQVSSYVLHFSSCGLHVSSIFLIFPAVFFDFLLLSLIFKTQRFWKNVININ